jgi:hypothetical protein
MKQKLFTLILTLSLISINSYSQSKHETASVSVGYDSLLFDGDNANQYNFLNATDDKCKIKVQDVFGDATGTFMVDTVFETCGEKHTEKVRKTGPLKRGVELIPGYEISTGGEGYKGKSGHVYTNVLMLDLGPSAVMLGRRTSAIIGSDCEIKLNTGSALVSGDHEIITSRTIITHKQTKYSVEIVPDGSDTMDIVKVFEGSVQVNPHANTDSSVAHFKKLGDMQTEMAKLNDDMINKRITIDEYKAKITELNDEMKTSENSLPKAVEVNAGYQCTVDHTGKISDPVPIESTETQWFDDVEK